MKSLAILAQDVMDMFYQDYKSDDEFFEHDFFVRQCQYAYESLLKAEYEKLRLEARAEGYAENIFVSFDTGWLLQEAVEINNDTKELKLKNRVFSFPYNESGVGVQDIIADDENAIVARTTISALWNLKYAPETSVLFWYIKAGNVIGFKGCGVGKATVYYLPAISADMFIADGLCYEIQKAVMVLMTAAKQGQVVDETNDGSQAQVKDTEINKSQLK